MNRYQNYYRFIQWDITSRCNLSCAHCRSESFYGSKDLERDMPFEAVCDRLEQLYEKGIRRIHFLGGEPFFRRDLHRIVAHAGDLGILCSVNTNGTLISRRRAEEIIDSGVFLLTFSIDGHDAKTNDRIRGSGSFEKTTKGVNNVLKAKRDRGAHTRLICSHVLMRPNVDTVDKMVDLCTDLELQNLIVTGLREMGGAIGHMSELGVTQDEMFDAAERLAKRMKAAPHCNVQIEVLSLLGKVLLNAKYELGLPIQRAGCDAVSSKAYMQPDGSLFPCQDIAKTASESGNNSASREPNSSLELAAFQSLARKIQDNETFRSFVPCAECPALGSLCVPCPLPAIRGEKVRKYDCIQVLKRAKREGVDFRSAIERSVSESLSAKILQSPVFRRDFFSTERPETLFQTVTATDDEASRLRDFRDSTLSEFSDLLRAGAAQLPPPRIKEG